MVRDFTQCCFGVEPGKDDDARADLPKGSTVTIRGQVATMTGAYQQLLVGLAFSNLFLFSKLRSVEGQITSIVRELGIRGTMSELSTSPEMPGGRFRTESVPPGPAPSL